MTSLLSRNQFYALVLLLVLLTLGFVVIFLLRYTPISDPYLAYTRIKMGLLVTTEKSGLSLRNVALSGNRYLSDRYILARANLYPQKPMLSIVPVKIGRDVFHQSGGWIRKIAVRKGVLEGVFITIEEQTPMAFWQSAEGFLTKDGGVLSSLGKLAHTKKARLYLSSLPVVEGEGDALRHKWSRLRMMLDDFPEILERIAVFRWVGKRRWNLVLKSGEFVKLPETDIRQSLLFLKRLQQQHRIFDRNFELIDVRFQNRLIVKEKSSGDKLPRGITVMLESERS